MQYYRCRCGETRSFGSMPPDRCRGCSKCGTNLVNMRLQGLDDHRPPQPHKFFTEQVETNDGPKPLDRCRWCLRTRAEIEAEPSPSHKDLPDA